MSSLKSGFGGLLKRYPSKKTHYELAPDDRSEGRNQGVLTPELTSGKVFTAMADRIHLGACGHPNSNNVTDFPKYGRDVCVKITKVAGYDIESDCREAGGSVQRAYYDMKNKSS